MYDSDHQLALHRQQQQQQSCSSAQSSLTRSGTATSIVDASGTLVRRVKSFSGQIPLAMFVSHVASMHQEGGFKREFAALQEWEERRRAMVEEAAEMAEADAVTAKATTDGQDSNAENRYSNISACEKLFLLRIDNTPLRVFFQTSIPGCV